MNERTRRHHHARRTNNQQQITSQQQGNNHHQQHNNRSIYHHGQPVETYSASNYRHPSTTTTTTDPSSIAPSQTSGDECAISICYSYLIAIISSFLVVLGIYLSVTKFNVRFLYVSLVGLLIEATGACIYCVGNIRASKLARRKQRINSDEFILNSASNIDNNNILPVLGRQQQHQHQRRQQQIATITHILSDRALTSSNITDENLGSINENSSSAINNDTHQLSQYNQQQTTARSRQESDRAAIDLGSPALPLAGESPPNAIDGSSTIVIPSLNSRQQADPTGQTNQAGQVDQTGHSSKLVDQTDQVVVVENPANHEQADHLVSQTDQADSTVCKSLATEDTSSDQLPNQDCQQSPTSTTTSGNFSSSTNLVDSQQGPVAGRSPVAASNHHRSRPSNLRRTMVIGLGGEEELIEIDEKELDNMSILPPSYESITTTTTPTITMTASSTTNPLANNNK